MPDTAENTDGMWHVRCVTHAREEVRQSRVLSILIVDDEVVGDVVAVCGFDDFGLESVQSDAFVPLCTENERFTVLQEYRIVSLCVLLRVLKESAIVIDVAVLINFDEGGAFVFKCRLDNQTANDLGLCRASVRQK